MKNKVIAFIAAIGISFAVATPASAQFLGPYYGGYYDGYYAGPQVSQRKQIIIRNSPGARVIEQDIFDW